MAALSPIPRMVFFDQLGNVIEAGVLYTYISGTDTPQPTYTDASGNTPNVNPFVFTNQGDDIWFKGSYKIDIKVNGVSIPGYPVDNVNVFDPVDWTGLTATIAELNATDTSTITTDESLTVNLDQRGKTILADATSVQVNVNLPQALMATNGFEITIKKIDVTANFVNLDAFSNETIEGRLNFILYDQNDTVTVLCDGDNWRIKSAVIRGNVQVISEAISATISDIGKTFVCSATAPYVFTLPSTALAGNGFSISIKKSNDAFPITVAVHDALTDSIDGSTSITLSDDYQCINLRLNVGDWCITSDSGLLAGYTGQKMELYDSVAPSGWIALDDGTIGNTDSGATTRANPDTKNLFIKLWDNIVDQYCPVSGGRGSTGLADFDANKTLNLPLTKFRGSANVGISTVNYLINSIDTGSDEITVNRVIDGNLYTGTMVTFTTTGSLPSPLAISTNYYIIYVSTSVFKIAATLADAYSGNIIDLTTSGSGINNAVLTIGTGVIGQFLGEPSHGNTENENGTHLHAFQVTSGNNQVVGGSGGNAGNPGANETDPSGLGSPHNNMQPTSFLYFYIKL